MGSSLELLVSALRKRGVRIAFEDGQGPEVKRRALQATTFNGAIELGARALVECADEPTVQSVVRVAASEGVPLAVVAGGHDMWARGFVDGNLILDVRRMSQVRADPAAGEVTVGGGTLTRDVLAALPDEMVTVTGTLLGVGLTGLAIGGGYGTLTSRFGLSADCIRRARVVLADGTVATASEEEDADLLWALRGGGSGMGVVTALTLALHPLPKVLNAMLTWPLDHAKEAMLHAQDLLQRHPVELSFFMGFLTVPAGEKVLFTIPFWTGNSAAGEALLQALASRDGAHLVYQRWSTFKETFNEEAEKAWPKGRHYHLLTRTLRTLNAGAIDILVEGARRMPAPTSAIILHDFHGTPASVPRNATAFALREDHFVVEIIAHWEPAAECDRGVERSWAERLDVELSHVALPGGYTNLLKPSEIDRVRQFYGASATRLLEIKRRVDPADLFRSGVGRLVG